MTHKKFILFIASLMFLSVDSRAETSGNCGPMDENGAYTSSCTWNYDQDTHTLYITGDGYMPYFNADPDPNRGGAWRTRASWRDFDEEIYHVEIGGNLKNIGGCAMHNMPNLQDINITAPIETIGQEVFGQLQNFEIPETVKTLEPLAFGYTHARSIVIPNSVEKIGRIAFAYSRSDLIIYCEDTTKERCASLIGENNPEALDKLQLYTKKGGYYEVNGVIYRGLNNLQKGIPAKRIYTIEEANRLSKTTGNKIMLRYK